MKPPKPTLSKNLEELEAKAHLAAEQRRHKEAILFYKDLLKQEPRPQWQQALAQAYRLRAEQVAGKGMWQEAAILWENHAKLCPAAKVSDDYLGWLALAGQFPKLAQLLANPATEIGDGPMAKRLPEALAILALQNEKLLTPFPKDHPIPKHHAMAKQALHAYCQGRDTEAEEALRQIPSRSPYRNVRTLVKALLLFTQDRAVGLESLGRIEGDSLCQGLARQILRLCQPGGPEFRLGEELPLILVGKLNGYDKAQLGLYKDAQKMGHDLPPKQVFNTVLNHRALLGESASRRACLAMLVGYPEGVDLFQKTFGKLPPFERKRLLALHEEAQQHYAQAALHWREAIDELDKQPQGASKALDQALIFRHIADMAKTGGVLNIAIDALKGGLKFDPDDRASYLDLVKLYEELDDPKQSQTWLDAGLKRFPKDVELLALAMREAARRKAFKKASGLAKTLLEIDPINSPARQFLLDAHLGHARKQARAGKPHLALQELEQARTLDARRKNAALCLLEGLLALKDPDRATALLVEGWRLAGKSLAAQFQLNLETLSLGLPLKATAGIAPALAKTHNATREELLALAACLSHYAGEDSKRISEAIKPLKTKLTKAIRQTEMSEEENASLCQTFGRAKQFDILHECAREAMLRFPQAAGPLYFMVYANCKGIATRMSVRDESQLEYALGLADRNNDRRTALLIESLLRKLDEAYEDDLHLEDFIPNPGKLQSKLTPELERRIYELETLSQAELLKIVSQYIPGMPLKSLPREELLNLARIALMGELGIDLKGLLGGLLPSNLPFGPHKLR